MSYGWNENVFEEIDMLMYLVFDILDYIKCGVQKVKGLEIWNEKPMKGMFDGSLGETKSDVYNK